MSRTIETEIIKKVFRYLHSKSPMEIMVLAYGSGKEDWWLEEKLISFQKEKSAWLLSLDDKAMDRVVNYIMGVTK